MDENRIDEVMGHYAEPGSPGAGVLVMRDGTVIQRAYGLSDVANGVAAIAATNYRLASVTKAFTAAAILRLEEMGQLSVGDRVRKFLPRLPHDVTIDQLLTHSSGIVDYEDLIPEGTTAQLHDEDVLTLLESQRSAYFEPGTSYRYSNSGYALLALIVERVSGRSFSDYLRDHIFIPLGMRDTVAHREGLTSVAHRAFGHSRDGTSWRRADQSLTSAVLGDGGVYSSVCDLSRWLDALDQGAFAQAAMPRVTSDDPAVRYGYGWRIRGDAVFHTGETIGFRNAVVRFPAERAAVAVLTNRDEGRPLDLALAIAAELVR